jgi:hypothetical protein
MGRKWECSTCSVESPAPDFEVGHSEPCPNCATGTATVVERPDPKLSAKQLECLRALDCVVDGASVWDFGSTTVNRLRKLGLIETKDSKARLTPAGVARLLASRRK